MSLIAQDVNQRYRVLPTIDLRKKREDRRYLDPQPPTAKVPEKVAVPVPVPMPAESAGTPRYQVRPPQFFTNTAPPAEQGLTRDILKQPMAPPMSPTGDTAVPPPAAAPVEPAEEISPALQALRKAQKAVEDIEATPTKKDSIIKSILKMLAYGAKDMPPARDWAEFAYGAGRVGGSGIAGAIDRRLPNEIKKRYQLGRAQETLERTQKTAQAESMIESRASMNKTRNARLNRDLTNDEQRRENQKRKAVADDLKRLPYIDPEDPEHAKILARAKAVGIDVDADSYGKGKNRPRIQVLDDDGVTIHWFEKDPAKGWVPVSIEGRNATARMTDKRNPLTGETYSSAERRAFAKQKFDWQKIEAQVDNNRAERALQLQKTGLDMRVAQAQAEAEAIDDVLPGMESDYLEQSGPEGDEYLAAQIQRAIATLKNRRGRAQGLAAGALGSRPSATPSAPVIRPKSDPLGLFKP